MAFSASGGSSSFSTLNFANSNNFTFSNSNGSVVLVPGVGTGTAYAQSNTTQATSGTFAQNSLQFAGAGNVSVGVSNGSIVISGSAAGGGGNATFTAYAQSNTTQGSSGTLNYSSINFAGYGAVSAGVSNGSVLVSGPATSSIIGTSGVSVSTTSNSIYVYPSPAQASFWNPFPAPQTTAGQVGNGSIAVQPMWNFGDFVSLSRIDVLASVSISSSSNSSHAGAISLYAGIYTLTGSTLSQLTSGSQSYGWTNTSSNSLSVLSGLRRLSVPVNINKTQAGDYWVAIISRTSTTNANWFTASNAFVTQATGQIAGLIGAATTATQQLVPGFGIYSTTSTGLPASMAISNITGIGYSSSVSALPVFIQANNFTA